MRPATRYAKSGDVSIAYQVLGSGGIDLILVMGWISHLEYAWEQPSFAHFLERLGSFARVIWFDKRGTGLSDRVDIADLPTLEQRMDDLRAVMDAAGSERAAIFGISEGGPMAALFAATHPRRASSLMLYGAYARMMRDGDYPWGFPEETVPRVEAAIRSEWGGPWSLPIYAPSMAGDPVFAAWWGTYMRNGASPGAALALDRMNRAVDVRHILRAICLPTLVLHRRDDRLMRVGHGRFLAAHIPEAKYVELPGQDHLVWVGDTDAVVDEVEEFLTGMRHGPEPERTLATVLFTDIVGSTEQAARLGDRRWREVLDAHRALLRRELERYRGREVVTTGDGVLALFDGPARAIRCAAAVVAGVRGLGLEIRAGLHAGEVEQMGADVGGIAVHIGARVAALAGPGEVLVSSTVKDLVAGSGIAFEERGSHVLKGVPGEWRLFAAKV